MKKVLSLMLAAVMLMSLLTACGGSSDPAKANPDAPQTEFKVVSGISALSGGYEDNVVLNAMQEKAGIKINWETMSDSLSEQVNIRISGGELPDAFQAVGFSNYDLARYGADGTFIDLTPYITPEIMPNLCAIFEKFPAYKSAITQEDGHIYGLPSGGRMGTAATGAAEDFDIGTIPQFTMINKKWLDELGLPVPTTTEELHEALVAFAENDMSAKVYGNPAGTTIPISCGYDQWCWGQDMFYAAFGFVTWSDVCRDLHLKSDGTVEFQSVTDAYRKAVTYYHDWIEEGLFDKEMFSQDHTQLISKCSQGYVGVGVWWEINELMGPYAEDYVYLPPLKGPEGDCAVTLKSGGGISSGNLSITSACKTPANLLKFYDQWYTGENVMQLEYGPIDVFYTGKGDDGMWISITDEEAQEKYGKSAGELKGVYEVYGPKLILSEYYSNVWHMEDRAYQRLLDLENFWFNYVPDKSLYPGDCVFTSEELEIIDMYKADFETQVAEQEALWLKNGGPTDEEWESYKQFLSDSCGMDQLLKVYQDAYNRYVAAQ